MTEPWLQTQYQQLNHDVARIFSTLGSCQVLGGRHGYTHVTLDVLATSGIPHVIEIYVVGSKSRFTTASLYNPNRDSFDQPVQHPELAPARCELFHLPERERSILHVLDPDDRLLVGASIKHLETQPGSSPSKKILKFHTSKYAAPSPRYDATGRIVS